MTSRRPTPLPRPVKSPGLLFAAVPPKPFEASVGRILGTLDVGACKAFGSALDKSPSWVSRVKDVGDPTHIRASEVAATCQALGSVAPVNELFDDVRINGHRWRMAPIPEAVEAESIMLDSMELAGAAGAYVATLGRAMADQEVDAGEAAELDDKLAELEEQVVALRSALRARRGAA